MTPPPALLLLTSADARVTILPAEGGAAVDLSVGGVSLLARTPWHRDVEPSLTPAADETEWVRRWRGGWQLCFPNAGQPDPGARPPQTFHGAASQTPWAVESHTPSSAALTWSDEAGLRAHRTWRLHAETLRVTTTAINGGDRARTVAVAEHLVLGGDLLAPALDGRSGTVDLAAGTTMHELDYAGLPTGRAQTWPGDPHDHWNVVEAATPARVVALTPPPRTAAQLSLAGRRVTVTWEGLPHLLLWEELARSPEAPWNSQVVALGIEPTSTPHGAGTGRGGGVELTPGAELRWSTTLRWDTGATGDGHHGHEESHDERKGRLG